VANNETTTYQCVKCKANFKDIWYTEYDFSKRNAYLTCSKCGVKLVADFDYKLITRLNDIYLILALIIGIAIIISSLVWSFDSVGEYVMYVGLLIGVPLIIVTGILEIPDIFPKVKNTRELE